MSDFDQREYQTVVLAALLHDIGKFYQRALGKGKGTHQQLGDECFEQYFAEKISNILSSDEVDIVRNAINNHHEYAEFITLADGLSAGMDRIDLQDYETGDPVKERLESVFQTISLGKHIPTENYRYHLKTLSLNKEDVFPIRVIEKILLVEEYGTLWEGFKNDLMNLQIHNLPLLVNSFYYLLWKYTWCVPGAVYKSEPDVSLFDHLKTTAAIAGCLFFKKKSGEQGDKEFLLFGGDLSGIQKFIYKITNVQGVKGVSKRLRGRSFYLSLMQEVLVLYLINGLSLSIPHIIFSGGGRFEMLLPNTKAVKSEINDINLEINKWLLKEYTGELGLVTTWIEADQNDIKDYSGLLKDLDSALSVEKKRKFKEFFLQDSFWVGDGKKEEDIRVCRSCGTTLVQKGVNDEICKLCEKHKEIGERLPKTEYIAYLSKPNKSIKGLEIPFENFGAAYLLSSKEYYERLLELQEAITVQKVNKTDDVAFRFIGNVAPIAKEDFVQDTEEEETKIAKQGNVLTFETMADMSIGDKRIGVLKMDVDYLGLIFAIGLEPQEKSEKMKKSISKVAAISRGMDWFFGGYLNEICKAVFEEWKVNAHKAGWENKADRVENIFYIVYSGGDDLLIVGPWSEIPKLAKAIKDEFKDYTCNNEDINLSAGGYLCKPKFPISIFSRAVGEELDKSKDKGRNRITILGDTVQWTENNTGCGFDDLLDFGETLYEAISTKDANSRLPRGFVHGLLKKHKQFEEGKDKNFIPAIIYQLERNVKSAATVVIKDEEKKLKGYLREKLITDKSGYFQKIKIPASYALLKSRKED
ncbi:MAG: type III-A CRISPR-associated protein Cas10/Csm1 [Thermodesulfobacteriota bacterium]